jgi:hypothetical protein
VNRQWFVNGLAVILFLFFIPTAFAVNQDKPTDQEKFTDLNGDGIRDNAADTDYDGIPDFENKESNSEEPEGLISFGDADQGPGVGIEESNRVQYKKRKFSCRALTSTRGEFGNSDVDAGKGVSGSVSGACAGGLCF